MGGDPWLIEVSWPADASVLVGAVRASAGDSASHIIGAASDRRPGYLAWLDPAELVDFVGAAAPTRQMVHDAADRLYSILDRGETIAVPIHDGNQRRVIVLGITPD